MFKYSFRLDYMKLKLKLINERRHLLLFTWRRALFRRCSAFAAIFALSSRLELELDEVETSRAFLDGGDSSPPFDLSPLFLPLPLPLPLPQPLALGILPW